MSWLVDRLLGSGSGLRVGSRLHRAGAPWPRHVPAPSRPRTCVSQPDMLLSPPAAPLLPRCLRCAQLVHEAAARGPRGGGADSPGRARHAQRGVPPGHFLVGAQSGGAGGLGAAPGRGRRRGGGLLFSPPAAPVFLHAPCRPCASCSHTYIPSAPRHPYLPECSLTDEPLDEPAERLPKEVRKAGLPADAFVTLRHGATLATAGGANLNSPPLLPVARP